MVEDIAEIMHDEELQDMTGDSVYETDTSAMIGRKAPIRSTRDFKENLQPPKKARKSLVNSWENEVLPNQSEVLPYETETPVSVFAIFAIGNLYLMTFEILSISE